MWREISRAGKVRVVYANYWYRVMRYQGYKEVCIQRTRDLGTALYTMATANA